MKSVIHGGDHPEINLDEYISEKLEEVRALLIKPSTEFYREYAEAKVFPIIKQYVDAYLQDIGVPLILHEKEEENRAPILLKLPLSPTATSAAGNQLAPNLGLLPLPSEAEVIQRIYGVHGSSSNPYIIFHLNEYLPVDNNNKKSLHRVNLKAIPFEGYQWFHLIIDETPDFSSGASFHYDCRFYFDEALYEKVTFPHFRNEQGNPPRGPPAVPVPNNAPELPPVIQDTVMSPDFFTISNEEYQFSRNQYLKGHYNGQSAKEQLGMGQTDIMKIKEGDLQYIHLKLLPDVVRTKSYQYTLKASRDLLLDFTQCYNFGKKIKKILMHEQIFTYPKST